MDVIIHQPKDLDILKKKAALVHAELIINYIQKLPCSKDQKLKIINDFIKKDLR